MGSIQNPKQYCLAISNITTHKVLTSWMHEASHWTCQCRILTARTSGHGKKMCRPWSQLAGNMAGHLAFIRGNENHIGGYNLILFCFFFWYELWSLLVSRGRAQYIYMIWYIHLISYNIIYLYGKYIVHMGWDQQILWFYIMVIICDLTAQQPIDISCGTVGISPVSWFMEVSVLSWG